jgi:two-component system phosphate regulon sensor histidine kinase PhoR
MLSHDIRSPLTSIRGFAELLRTSPPETEGELEELVSPILTSADRVQGLLTDFLALSRIESPAFTLHPEALPVAEHLHRVVAALLPQIRQRSVRLLEDYPPGELCVWADPLRFEQVFTNLITNALKYGPDGQTVTVCAEATPPWVRIRIADCGFGIPEAVLDRIFESFFRVRRPETEGIPGTGLGLAITERLVTLHGGRILVESRLGVGSTFTVEWPADAAQVPG